ncbi:endonuclease V [Myxococcota bacterium]|nr:endonuclease V [Myxococcota bacterium]MBU1430445.1 endonuclease V [Myxococcota bacterium]MBU1896278.1 endonuclease V [Myxococcota bacterium]
MIFAVDVQYEEARRAARAGGALFEGWASAAPLSERVATFEGVEAYVPGEFYRRELPCILGLLGADRPDLIIVDGYVDLGARPGLGRHLFEALGGAVGVVGVAKSFFHAAAPARVTRGDAQRPLFITAAGLPLAEAVEGVRAMAGPHRHPTLLKRVDHLARGWLTPQIAE